MNFCSNCGSEVTLGDIPGEDRPRYHCPQCKTIHYQNPAMIVGCLPYWEDKVLLCKRAIEPRYGLWTLPAGFLEIGEQACDGALRETHEEARANAKIERLFSVYDLPTVGQVYLMFLAKLQDLNFEAGSESLEVRLFRQEEVPWDQMAFSAIEFTLRKYFENFDHTGDEVFMGCLTRTWKDKTIDS